MLSIIECGELSLRQNWQVLSPMSSCAYEVFECKEESEHARHTVQDCGTVYFSGAAYRDECNAAVL